MTYDDSQQLHRDPAYAAAVDALLDAAIRTRDLRMQLAELHGLYYRGDIPAVEFRQQAVMVRQEIADQQTRADEAVKAAEDARQRVEGAAGPVLGDITVDVADLPSSRGAGGGFSDAALRLSPGPDLSRPVDDVRLSRGFRRYAGVKPDATPKRRQKFPMTVVDFDDAVALAEENDLVLRQYSNAHYQLRTKGDGFILNLYPDTGRYYADRNRPKPPYVPPRRSRWTLSVVVRETVTATRV